MIYLTVSEIIELHEKVVAATGGSHGIRDTGLLESAVFGCYQSFSGVDLYPTVIEKAARMAYAVCKNHPFVDGNKRTAVTSMLVILRMNDIVLSYTQKELIAFGFGIADGCVSYEDIVMWINSHVVLPK
jgi:death-on-curing protein